MIRNATRKFRRPMFFLIAMNKVGRYNLTGRKGLGRVSEYEEFVRRKVMCE